MKRSKRVLFRCDGGKSHGVGHLSRCLSLARHLLSEAPGIQTWFWGQYDEFAKQLLTEYALPILATPIPPMDSSGITSTLEACASFDVLVLDSYAVNQSYIDGLKQRKCRLALIDDDQRCDLRDVDVVICFRAGAEALNYGSRHQFLGPSYLLAKPELRALREHNLSFSEARPLERILVFLSGGSLGSEHLPGVLGALQATGLQVTYLSPRALDIPGLSYAKHAAFTPEIESIYAMADFVICGGGLTKYECAYAGISNACLSLTALQAQDTKEMALRGLTLDLGLADSMRAEHLRQQIEDFRCDPEAVNAQRKAFATQVDSDGPRRIAQTLIAL